MKNLKKTITSLLSSVAVMMVIGTTAMAADASNEGFDTTENICGTVASHGELQLDNEDDLLIYNMMEDPEAYGLVLLDKTEETEGNFLVVTSIYKESRLETAATLPTGSDTFCEIKYVYADDNPNNAILRTYVSAVISWNSLKKQAIVDPKSINASFSRYGSNRYPVVVDHDTIYENNLMINLQNCGYVRYPVTLVYGENRVENLNTMLGVNYMGEQIKVPETVANWH